MNVLVYTMALLNPRSYLATVKPSHPLSTLQSVSTNSDWPGICGCCDSGPAACVLGKYCCLPCSYGKAMEMAGAGNCILCCLCGVCCSPCNTAKIDET